MLKLEGLTKRLKYRIVISADGYQQLSEEMRRKFADLGPQRVRGKSEPIYVFGTEAKGEGE